VKSNFTSGLERGLASLEAWGLVDGVQLAAGGWQLSTVARRHQNLRLECGRWPGLFIKWASGDTRETLRTEAGFYAYCQARPRVPRVAELMPTLHSFVEGENALVTELVAGARTLFPELRAHPASAIPLSVFAALGQALATLHGEFGLQRAPAAPVPPGLSQLPPPPFGMHHPRAESLAHLSQANLKILGILQSQPGLIGRLEALAMTWRKQTVIHGDVRSENLLVLPASPGEQHQVRLVDWEYVRWGDPAWDVGSGLAEILRFWLLGLPLETDLAAEDRAAAAEYPLQVLQPAMRELWRAYCAAADVEGDDLVALLRRSVEQSALRLIRLAWEYSQEAAELSSLAVLLLQTGVNVLENPEEAVGVLYALDRGSEP